LLLPWSDNLLFVCAKWEVYPHPRELVNRLLLRFSETILKNEIAGFSKGIKNDAIRGVEKGLTAMYNVSFGNEKP